VPVHRPELGVGGVGMGVEMDDRNAPSSDVPGHSRHVRQRDGVVTTEDDGDRARARDLLHGTLEAVERRRDLARQHLDIAGVDHTELDQGVHAQSQMGRWPSCGR